MRVLKVVRATKVYDIPSYTFRVIYIYMLDNVCHGGSLDN